MCIRLVNFYVYVYFDVVDINGIVINMCCEL